jgi:transcriptional regulator with XRE-family HTH domain
MIEENTVAEIRRLLAEGSLSQRKIAGLTHVSRGTVSAIASGRRPQYDGPTGDDWAEPTGPPVRCPDCGGMVYLPCQLCRVRKLIAKRRRTPQDRTGQRKDAFEPIDLDLRPDHRARYEEVRAWRRENNDCLVGD